MHSNDQDGSFQFMSDWRTFAPIAFTNLLLCIVTLGIYGFWARTRERRFLWANTRFIDEPLDWTGTGLELLIGWLLAVGLFGLPLAALQFGIQALLLRGYTGIGGALAILLYFAALYVTGIAIFRALRYRLSRTFWRGIRGGSDAQGFRFGLSYVWRTLLGSLLLGLLIPWSMVSLWNQRWNAMSFGPMAFRADARPGPLMGRFLLFYLLPFLIVVAGIAAAVLGVVAGVTVPRGAEPGTLPAPLIVVIAVFYLIFFVLLGLISLIYYAAYFREVVGTLTLGELEFEFTARTRDWLMLAIGNFALALVTLGIGYIFVGYRNWTFFVRHMRAYGEIDAGALTQSTTREPGQGEGLLDAFDVGAI